MKAIIFDLDDTLYSEREYFASGFQAVGDLLSSRGIGTAQAIANRLLEIQDAQGRDRVFQYLADELCYPQSWIPELVLTIRTHRPKIQLAADALKLLPQLRPTFRLGCVTDGWAAVQRLKIEALDLLQWMDSVVVADDYGRSNWKPSPFPLLQCCEKLGCPPDTVVFIGDNPQRDMPCANKANAASIRIRRRGCYFSNTEPSTEEEHAWLEIGDLSELEHALIRVSAMKGQPPHSSHSP